MKRTPTFLLPLERLNPEALTGLAEYSTLEMENAMPQEMATVPVKSPWASTINWAALGGAIAGVAAVFNLPVDATMVSTVLSYVPIAIGAFTAIKNTWFSRRVLAPSVPAK